MNASTISPIDKALCDMADASFECGEWNRNESDEPYDALHERAKAARGAVLNLFHELQAAQRQVASVVLDGEIDDPDAGTEYEMEIDDAYDTLARVVRVARDALSKVEGT